MARRLAQSAEKPKLPMSRVSWMMPVPFGPRESLSWRLPRRWLVLSSLLLLLKLSSDDITFLPTQSSAPLMMYYLKYAFSSCVETAHSHPARAPWSMEGVLMLLRKEIQSRICQGRHCHMYGRLQ